jgi:hypothetical protein
VKYQGIVNTASDPDLRLRFYACAVKENKALNGSASAWLDARWWYLCAKNEINESYQYAVENDHPNPGIDEGVVTDAMILAAVQPME